MTAKRDKKSSPSPRGTGPQTEIHGDVHGPVLSGNFNGPVHLTGAGMQTVGPPSPASERLRASGRPAAAPAAGRTIVVKGDVTNSILNFGDQHGVSSTGDRATIVQVQGAPPVVAPGAAVPPPPPAPTPPPPPREGRRRALAMPDGAGGSDDGLLARFCVGWKDYDTQAHAFLAALGIRWEPIELGAPPTPTAWTYGFELLGEGPAGENFPCLVEAAAQFHVTPVDLRVALVVKALEAIRALRAALRTAFGPRADALRLTVNVDEVLVGSPAFVEAIRHSQVDENTLFEVNEALPLAQVNDLMRIAAAYRLNLALDDSNNLDHAVRHALLHRVKLVKVDHGFTRQQFRQMSNLRPRQVMDALVALRAPEAPLVLEGIESRLEADFIQAHWQESDGPLYFQGWSIRLGAELRRFFEPVNTEEQPKGYRMR